MNEKTIFAMFVIIIIAAMQLFAWYMRLDGAVFAFTSFIIGTTAGVILGFKMPFSVKIDQSQSGRGK